MIDRMVTMSELERDSRVYDAFTKGHAEGRIAGLKEALEIAERHDDPHWGEHEPMNAMARKIIRAISARISALEKDHA